MRSPHVLPQHESRIALDRHGHASRRRDGTGALLEHVGEREREREQQHGERRDPAHRRARESLRPAQCSGERRGAEDGGERDPDDAVVGHPRGDDQKREQCDAGDHQPLAAAESRRRRRDQREHEWRDQHDPRRPWPHPVMPAPCVPRAGYDVHCDSEQRAACETGERGADQHPHAARIARDDVEDQHRQQAVHDLALELAERIGGIDRPEQRRERPCGPGE